MASPYTHSTSELKKQKTNFRKPTPGLNLQRNGKERVCGGNSTCGRAAVACAKSPGLMGHQKPNSNPRFQKTTAKKLLYMSFWRKEHTSMSSMYVHVPVLRSVSRPIFWDLERRKMFSWRVFRCPLFLAPL